MEYKRNHLLTCPGIYPFWFEVPKKIINVTDIEKFKDLKETVQETVDVFLIVAPLLLRCGGCLQEFNSSKILFHIMNSSCEKVKHICKKFYKLKIDRILEIERRIPVLFNKICTDMELKIIENKKRKTQFFYFCSECKCVFMTDENNDEVDIILLYYYYLIDIHKFTGNYTK